MKSFTRMRILAVALAWTTTGHGQNLDHEGPLTAVALYQDKPPCVIQTIRLWDSETSTGTELELARVEGELRTTSDQTPFHLLTNVVVSPNGDFRQGMNAIPGGAGIVLPSGTSFRAAGNLISVRELKRTAELPPLPRSTLPHIRIAGPTNRMTSSRWLQVRGLCNVPLRRVRYDLINSTRRLLDDQAFITETDFDPNRWQTTTNHFECFDVELAPGTNLIRIRCEDLEGRVVTTNVIFTLRFDEDKNPPVLSIQSPLPGTEISGSTFTLRGQSDDASVEVVGTITSGGRSERITGIVERNGRFWVENIPFLGKTNLLMLTATDDAGNSSHTNIAVSRSDHLLTIDKVPQAQLWQLQTKVTGKVHPADQEVWVNGRKADVETNGTWAVTGIPLSKDGVAIFEASSFRPPAAARVQPASTADAVGFIPSDLVSVRAKLGRSGLTLNATRPTYNTFRLQLADTAGRDFVLFTSTNLIDWVPLLTNRQSGPTFEWAMTNAMDYGCQFFRVLPAE